MTHLPLVLIGAGGHASVIADACETIGFLPEGYLAPGPSTHPLAARLLYLGNDDRLDDVTFRRGHCFIIGLGEMAARSRIADNIRRLNLVVRSIVHPSAIIGNHVNMEGGIFIAAGAIVNSGSRIGEHAILNTGSIVDHDCDLGDLVQIGPGATLAGGVVCGKAASVGAGGVIMPGVKIGSGATVGAGAVAVQSVPPDTVVIGVPAKPLAPGPEAKC